MVAMAYQQLKQICATAEVTPMESDVYVHTPEAVASLSMCLADIGETPYSQVKGRGKTYSRQKFKRLLKQ